jgi:glucose-1-phosphate cytidylyltransferase
LTYGDGISNVDIDKLLKFHNNKKKQVTLTAVRPPARFGAIKIKDDHVKYFKEKSNLDEGWINGGFFVINPEFLKNIKNDKTYLEREPLEIMTKKKQLVAYKHYGYWHCMDTKRDKDNLDLLFKKKLIK